MKNKVDEFAKIKYYRILIIKILLLSLLLSTFMVIFSFNVELSDVDKSALLRWIDTKIDVNGIMVSYKNNVIGEKVFAAYYLYIHPIIALIIVVPEIALGNNSLNNDEYRDFYMYSVEIYGKERGGVKTLLIITILLHLLFYSGYLNQMINFQFATWGVLVFNATINTFLLGLLAVLTLALHSFLTNYLR